MRKSSFEAAEYIDHIEKQLEQVRQAMHSPKSGKPIHDKMRILKAENARLQKTIDELEASFETRVKSSVEHMAAGEGGLRRKMRALEEDLRERDLRIEELEYEHEQVRLDQGTMETLKATIERLEGEKRTLEDANSSVEKRNEILTEMLAFSPTKSQGFELTSPLRNRGRLPRPVSMMSWTRFPSSPTSKQPSRPSSMVNSPTAMSPREYFSPRNVLELELEHPCNDADSGLGESCSAKSPITSSSRHSTMASQTSTSPSAWGLPLPVSPGESGGTIRPIQKRKPRRFMTGSTQLKPLLLPSMAAETAGLSSPRSPTRSEMVEFTLSIDQTVFMHDLEGSLTSPKREVFLESMDPTTSFLSNPFEDVNLTEGSVMAEPGSSPPHLSSLDDSSPSSVEAISLAVELDDASFLHDGIDCDIDGETGVEEEEEMAGSDSSPERRTLFSPEQSRRPHPVSAESLPVEDIRSSPTTQDRLMTSIEALMHIQSTNDDPFDTSPNPRKRRRTSSMSHSDDTILANPPTNLPSLTDHSTVSTSTSRSPSPSIAEILRLTEHDSAQHQPEISPINLLASTALQRTISPSMSPKRLSRSTTPLEILQRRSASSSPLAVVTIRSIYGTLSRYTTYIRELKRDPLALARRVIANAWCSNWKRFGKLSWWVLGIFLPGGRKDFAEVNAWDWGHYDGEAVADRFCPTEIAVDEPVARPELESCSSPGKRSVRFETQHEPYRTHGSKTPAKPALKGGQEREAGLGKSLYLWGKFSVAIMLAVGGAVWKGPGEMLRDCDGQGRMEGSPKKELRLSDHEGTRERTPSASPDFDDEDGERVLPKRPKIFELGTSFDFSKTGRSPSSVFTFRSPEGDNFWDEDDDDGDGDLEGELRHYHAVGYGESGDGGG
jgi:hypothetical protein